MITVSTNSPGYHTLLRKGGLPVVSKHKKLITMDNILQGPFADFADVFSQEGFDELPPHQKWDHVIDLKPDYVEWNTKVYPLRQDQEPALNEFIDQNLASG